jgi:hypothetical protein
MRSRFVSVPNHVLAHERRGLASRVVGTIASFLIGAVVATELYRQNAADRPSEHGKALDSGRVASLIPAPVAISDRAEALSPRGIAEYTGGPIPQITFPPTQPPAAAKETQAMPDEDRSASVVSVEKPRRTENKSANRKRASHRGNGDTQDRLYGEQPSYWAAARGWNSWGGYQGGFDYGPRPGRGIQFDRRGQFPIWHGNHQ